MTDDVQIIVRNEYAYAFNHDRITTAFRDMPEVASWNTEQIHVQFVRDLLCSASPCSELACANCMLGTVYAEHTEEQVENTYFIMLEYIGEEK